MARSFIGKDGFLYCECFKHWRTGQLVYRKNGGYFRFPCGRCKKK